MLKPEESAGQNRFIRPSLAIEIFANEFAYSDEYMQGPAYYDIPLLRVYAHEFLHFWQLLSHGFFANMALSEWSDLIQFENTHVVGKPSKIYSEFYRVDVETGYSAYDIVECLARYWDIHILGPEKLREWIIGKDLYDRSFSTKRILPSYREPKSYSGRDFDSLVSSEEGYTRPYLAIVNRLGSFAAAIFFPLLAHFSLQTRQPATVFKIALTYFEKYIDTRLLVSAAIKVNGSNSVNEAWRMYYEAVRDIVGRIYAELFFGASLTSGLKPLLKGAQGNELFKYYGTLLLDYSQKVRSARDYSLDFYFATPGDPESRSVLLSAFQPPLVLFRNGYWVRTETQFERFIQVSRGKISPPLKLAHYSLDINTRYKSFLRNKLFANFGYNNI
jgi:hypothetical protein